MTPSDVDASDGFTCLLRACIGLPNLKPGRVPLPMPPSRGPGAVPLVRRLASPTFLLCVLLPTLFVPTSLGVVDRFGDLQLGPALDMLFGASPCNKVETTIMLIGDVDNFNGAGATDPPSPGLQGYLASINAAPRQFDEGGLAKHFAHKVGGLPSSILSGSLLVHVSALSPIDSLADVIHLQYMGGGAFHQPGTLLGASNGNWPSTTSVTIPFSSALRSAVNGAGFLEVYIADDTMVDYMELTLRHCVCDGPLFVTEIVQGTVDGFVGAEPTTPRLPFDQWVGSPQRGFDEGGPDKDFATTLFLPDRACLLRAVLEVSLESQDDLVSTDGISFQYTGGTPPFAYNEPLAYTGVQTFTYNLGTLPGATSFLDDMATQGVLDIYIQDDSSVDYVRLALTYG